MFENLKNKLTNLTSNGNTSFNTACTNQGSQLADRLLFRIVSTTITSLSHSELYEGLFKDNLVKNMMELVKNGNLKGWLYLDLQGRAVAFRSEKSAEGLKTLKEVEVDIKLADSSLYQVVLYISELFNVLLNTGGASILMSKAVILKFESARASIPNDYLKNVQEQVGAVLKDVAVGKSQAIILDSKDDITTLDGEFSKVDTATKDALFSYLSLFTGFPASFFSGIFSNGLGSTNAGEREMIAQAKMVMYHTYFSPFFKLIDERIDIKIGLTDQFSPKEAVDIATMHEDIIDLDEVLRQFNFPMKKDY